MSLRSQWNSFTGSEPGSRFLDFYESRQQDRSGGHRWRRALYVGLGVVFSIGGILLLGMPGPGLLVVALGLAMIAGEFEVMARGLDKLELWLRQTARQFLRWWQHLRPYQRGLGITVAVVVMLGAAGCAYKILT